MSVGLSIFLSAVFLGAVALYIFTHQSPFLWAAFIVLMVALYISTKDRWDWKKLVRKTILLSIVAAITLATLGGLFGIYEWNESRPKVQDRFWDIPLGATKADVKFMKGEPSRTDGDTWIYAQYGVEFSEDRVARVVYEGSYSGNFQGIQSNYSTSDDVRKKFGEPTEVRTSPDNLRRSFFYAKYHVWFGMSENRVRAFGIYDPRTHHIRAGSKAPDANAPDRNEPKPSSR